MLINNKTINQHTIQEIITVIKLKKELNTISDEFVQNQVYEYVTKNTKAIQFLTKPKSKEYKLVVKEVRAQLRKVYGLFRSGEETKKRKELVDTLRGVSSQKQKESIKQILETHSSTQERIAIYEELYEKIFALTKKPKIIIDLGSGINPFSIPYMKLQNVNYYAYDISQEEIDSLNTFFTFLHAKNKNFKGNAEILDILHFAKLPKADICFLFKMTDVLDRGKGHKTTEEMVLRIPAKYIVISFATRTMSGKKMTAPRRNWMEWMCTRLGFTYAILEFPNEIFYVVKK
ncbi:hypothetical protein COV17_04595 [Candidatus Woesearchaeota archaeon CG10_big_fil_rev_8_21_14_0_10_36_11]|nr:MAG: hypothetical protein COV17_04595 [Candidatus Woesearchaeota archaeon CG10_big_fil_rev_8_21_14_0_10_36_11]